MRVTGKIRKQNEKSLSIQYSLSGLSFYSPLDGKLYGPMSIEELPVILYAVNGEEGQVAEKIILVINTDRFVAVPTEIYDQDYEKDYLYTKNIVCGDDEVIMNTTTGGVVVIYPVNCLLLEVLGKKAPEIKVLHSLNPCLSVACRYAEKSKKHVFVAGMLESVFSYAVVGKKTILAIDCIADGGVTKAKLITEMLDRRYGLAKGVVLVDNNGVLASMINGIVGKPAPLSYDEYMEIIDEDNKR